MSRCEIGDADWAFAECYCTACDKWVASRQLANAVQRESSALAFIYRASMLQIGNPG